MSAGPVVVSPPFSPGKLRPRTTASRPSSLAQGELGGLFPEDPRPISASPFDARAPSPLRSTSPFRPSTVQSSSPSRSMSPTAGGSPGSPNPYAENVYTQSIRRKREHKHAARQQRHAEFFEAWDREAARRKEAKDKELTNDRRDGEVLDQWIKTEMEREKERKAMMFQQRQVLSSTNASLAVERARKLLPRAEEMGDIFEKRREPSTVKPDADFLKKQMAERRAKEAAERAIERATPVPDWKAEQSMQATQKKIRAEELRRSYEQQIADKSAEPYMRPPNDNELSFFFRDMTPTQAAEKEQRLKEEARRKAVEVQQRNIQDSMRNTDFKRLNMQDDAKRERDLLQANKLIDDKRRYDELMFDHQRKRTMLQSWEDESRRKKEEASTEKQMMKGWKDRLPFKNESSDDES